MTIEEYNNRKVPEYYDTMYLDGYTPQEIYQAFHKKMIEEHSEKKDIPTVEIVSEIN